MNISKLLPGMQTSPGNEIQFNKENKTQQTERLQIPKDILEINTSQGTPNPEKNLNNLSPVNQYRYLDGQATLQDNVKLRVIPGNPQKTLSLANKAINQAIMPPVFSNPDRQQLQQAIQLKQLAKGMLDKAA